MTTETIDARERDLRTLRSRGLAQIKAVLIDWASKHAPAAPIGGLIGVAAQCGAVAAVLVDEACVLGQDHERHRANAEKARDEPPLLAKG